MFYVETESTFDGSPIVLCITNVPTGGKASKNAKTGAILQTWILAQDVDPLATSRQSRDGAICGDCPRRHSLGGDCYVLIHNAPLSVWRAYKRGSYERLDLRKESHRAILRGHPIRLGSYGDPVAVPLAFWQKYFEACSPSYHTGYSHSWQLDHAQPYQKFLMASADSPSEAFAAQALGWRTFRVRDGEADALDTGVEIVCPASAEAGYRKTCAECGACDGAGSGAQRRSIAIVAHGARSQVRLRRGLSLPAGGTQRTFAA